MTRSASGRLGSRRSADRLLAAVTQFYKDNGFFPQWTASNGGGPGLPADAIDLLVSPGTEASIITGEEVPVLSTQVVAGCTPVPERSMSAEPASTAWSRSSPDIPVRTTMRSGRAVRTSSVAGSHSNRRIRESMETLAYLEGQRRRRRQLETGEWRAPDED